MSAAGIRRFGPASTLAEGFRGGVVAIGNFDGIHRGHQAVLGAAIEIAGRDGIPALCLTFEPHPRSVFAPDRPVLRLTPPPVKARLLAALGFAAVVEQPFDRAFAALSADEFVRAVLVEGLGARHVVVGFDFCYGAKRSGTVATLRAAGERYGFGVTAVEAFADESGAPVSSSRIRHDLGQGNVAGAAALLGYRWTIEAPVIGGQKLGRQLGYPTANMALVENGLLAHGIYAVRLRRSDGTLLGGVASYGRRPTFDNGAALFETFLFDFAGDLYGETCDVALFAWLRGEEKFDRVEALIRQMDRDAEEARAALAGAQPLSPLDRLLSF
ncbi:bifunctional riboflavin kinase/FAD synthetase [Aureimonas leprariae]|uniref:Riboflavin biosynthesis protein n=1 Tax=Plantimonas leprariae TaxID=2615207 RepID=A0A7V7TY51_9HYPH|nr:bifunctional riboflavin kinase/FAD synthetase [Aureimonas leprariae]KAB0682607.1 bifunctional riboflavin kinase/FAD synthetase [Aureimonas leprariae]